MIEKATIKTTEVLKKNGGQIIYTEIGGEWFSVNGSHFDGHLGGIRWQVDLLNPTGDDRELVDYLNNPNAQSFGEFKRAHRRFYELHYTSETEIMNDFARLSERLKKYDEIEGARVGDYIKIGSDYHRIVEHYGERVQIGINGSFYLGNGYLSHSGECGKVYEKNLLIGTSETRRGSVWINHRDRAGAGRGLTDCAGNFRVFTLR